MLNGQNNYIDDQADCQNVKTFYSIITLDILYIIFLYSNKLFLDLYLAKFLMQNNFFPCRN